MPPTEPALQVSDLLLNLNCCNYLVFQLLFYGYAAQSYTNSWPVLTDLVLFKKWPTDVAVEGVSEVSTKAQQSLGKHRGMFCLLNGQQEEVDKPDKWVLVHWVNFCQVHYGEEEDLTVDCNWFVSLSSYIDLFLCFFCNCLQFKYF